MSVTAQDIKEGKINDEIGNQLESLSAQMEAGLEQGRNMWADWRAAAQDTTRRTTEALNNMAREKPWQLVGGAAAVGLLIGVLFSARRR